MSLNAEAPKSLELLSADTWTASRCSLQALKAVQGIFFLINTKATHCMAAAVIFMCLWISWLNSKLWLQLNLMASDSKKSLQNFKSTWAAARSLQLSVQHLAASVGSSLLDLLQQAQLLCQLWSMRSWTLTHVIKKKYENTAIYNGFHPVWHSFWDKYFIKIAHVIHVLFMYCSWIKPRAI